MTAHPDILDDVDLDSGPRLLLTVRPTGLYSECAADYPLAVLATTRGVTVQLIDPYVDDATLARWAKALRVTASVIDQHRRTLP
jgi:hypothetical protein